MLASTARGGNEFQIQKILSQVTAAKQPKILKFLYIFSKFISRDGDGFLSGRVPDRNQM